ncbi:hypothetical protein ACCO45_013314 [Purpureocillium lilacinum]|uniref:Uncharacterized protein n=1 Tax=Purpureocillium lilacinum TaxID=33203 RepID=A0ACC4DAH1_PURLI
MPLPPAPTGPSGQQPCPVWAVKDASQPGSGGPSLGETQTTSAGPQGVAQGPARADPKPANHAVSTHPTRPNHRRRPTTARHHEPARHGAMASCGIYSELSAPLLLGLPRAPVRILPAGGLGPTIIGPRARWPLPRRATSPSHPVQSSLLRQTSVLLCSTVLRRAQRGTRPARLRPREGRPRAMSGRRHGWPPLCATCHRIPRTLRRGPGCRRPHGPHGSFAAEPRSLSSRDRGMSPWCHFVSGNGARVDTPTPKARKLCGGFHSSSHLCALRVVACLLRLGEHPSRQEPTTPWPAGRARGALNSPRAIGDVVVALFGRR